MGVKEKYDLEVLITEAVKFDDYFKDYLDFGRKLTGFYFEERYPPGPVSTYSKEEIGRILNTAKDIIGKINIFCEK